MNACRLRTDFHEPNYDLVGGLDSCVNAFETALLGDLYYQNEGLAAVFAGIARCLHHRHCCLSALNHVCWLLPLPGFRLPWYAFLHPNVCSSLCLLHYVVGKRQLIVSTWPIELVFRR